MTICPECNGRGVLKRTEKQQASDGGIRFATHISKCERCDGKGYFLKKTEKDH